MVKQDSNPGYLKVGYTASAIIGIYTIELPLCVDLSDLTDTFAVYARVELPSSSYVPQRQQSQNQGGWEHHTWHISPYQ